MTNSKEQLKNELEALQTDIEALSEIWDNLIPDSNGDILVPEDTANKIAIILGF